MNETSGQNMVIQFQSLLSKLGLMHYVITFWKTKALIWQPWHPHCAPSLTMNKW
jgi:hypothetical protein